MFTKEAFQKNLFEIGKILLSCCIALVFFQAHSAQAAQVTIVSGGGGTRDEQMSNPNTVFTSDQVGYTFYRDGGGSASIYYLKTTDGGATWGTPVNMLASSTRWAVWYDQWTPGNTTGTAIHVANLGMGNGKLFYFNLETSTDTLTSSSASLMTANSWSSMVDTVSIAKGTDGKIYIAAMDDSVSKVIKCSSSCTIANNWSDAAVSSPLPFSISDWALLQPLASGNMLLLHFDSLTSDIESKVYNVGANTWDASWTTIDANATNNTTYDNAFGATLDRTTNDIYLAYTADVATIGGNDDDIRTAIYSGGVWQNRTNCITNDTRGITEGKIAINQNSGELYCIITARATAATAATGDIFYKKSTNRMLTWGSETQVNSTQGDHSGADANFSSTERLFVTWRNGTSDIIAGATIADLAPTTSTQSAYRFFINADSADVGAAAAAQDTATTTNSARSQFRLRMLMHLGGDGLVPAYKNFKLQVAAKSGTCDTSFSGETYADVDTSSGAIRFYNNTTPADGAAVTVNASDPTHGAHTGRAQTYEESNNFTVTSTVASGEDGLWDFSLVDSATDPSSSYCFRMVESDGTQLTAYSVIPEFISPAVSAGTTVYQDTNADGRVDRILITLGQTVTACTYDAADWTINTAGSINVSAVTGISCTGSDSNLKVAVTADANETGGATNPVISYANAGTTGSVVVTGGALTAQSNLTATDSAAPVILSTSPANGTGAPRSGEIIADFSETMTITACTFTSDPDPGDFPSIKDPLNWSVGVNGGVRTRVTLVHYKTYAEAISPTVTIAGCTDGVNALGSGPVSNPWTFSMASNNSVSIPPIVTPPVVATSTPPVSATGEYSPIAEQDFSPDIGSDKNLIRDDEKGSCMHAHLIKGSSAAVYFCGKDGKRYAFPNQKIFFSWYIDFSGVRDVSDAELAAIPLGGNVTYRPGVRMIKIMTDPKVYAVSHGGWLRWITTEAIAMALYGEDWNKQIDDVSDAFFVNYRIGDPIVQ